MKGPRAEYTLLTLSRLQVTGGTAGGDEGEEEPYYDPSWPHLQVIGRLESPLNDIYQSPTTQPRPLFPWQVVYEFLLRFIVSPEVSLLCLLTQICQVFRLVLCYCCLCCCCCSLPTRSGQAQVSEEVH